MLDAVCPQPLYFQLMNVLRCEILSLRPGQQLPTDRELMEKYRVSSTTVRQALQKLVDEGLITRKAGRGTFVNSMPITDDLAELHGFGQLTALMGLPGRNRLIEVGFGPAPEGVSDHLRLPQGAEVWKNTRIRYVENQPVCVQRGYWRKELGVLLASEDVEASSFYPLLEKKFGVVVATARETISARTATRLECELLDLPKSSPILAVEHVAHTADGVPCEVAHNAYRADSYRFTVVRHRRLGESVPVVTEPTGVSSKDP